MNAGTCHENEFFRTRYDVNDVVRNGYIVKKSFSRTAESPAARQEPGIFAGGARLGTHIADREREARFTDDGGLAGLETTVVET